MLEVEVKYCENGLLIELSELAGALATVAAAVGEEAAAVSLGVGLATTGVGVLCAASVALATLSSVVSPPMTPVKVG